MMRFLLFLFLFTTFSYGDLGSYKTPDEKARVVGKSSEKVDPKKNVKSSSNTYFDRKDIIKDFLLLEIPFLDNFSKFLNRMAENLLLPVFLLAIILEFVSENAFLSVLKRLITSVLFLSFFTSFHHGVTDYGFEVAESIVKSSKGKNAFLKNWSEARKDVKKNKGESNLDKFFSFMKRTYSFVLGADLDFIASALNSLIIIGLLINMCIFSVVFHFNTVLVGLVAVLSIFSFNKDLILSPIKTTIWCTFVPILISGIIVTIGSVLGDDGNETFFGIIQSFVLSLLILFSLPLAAYILKGDIVQWASNMGFIGGTGIAVAGGKAIGRTLARPLQSLSSPLSSVGRFTSDFASEARKGIAKKVLASGGEYFPEESSNFTNQSTSIRDYMLSKVSGSSNKSDSKFSDDISSILKNKVGNTTFSKYRKKGNGVIKSGLMATASKFGNITQSSPDSIYGNVQPSLKPENLKKRQAYIPESFNSPKVDPHGFVITNNKPEVMTKRLSTPIEDLKNPISDIYGVGNTLSKPEIMKKRDVPSTLFSSSNSLSKNDLDSKLRSAQKRFYKDN